MMAPGEEEFNRLLREYGSGFETLSDNAKVTAKVARDVRDRFEDAAEIPEQFKTTVERLCELSRRAEAAFLHAANELTALGAFLDGLADDSEEYHANNDD